MEGPPEAEVDICTVLRGIYHSTKEPETKQRARIATAMAKKMHMRLLEYKKMFAIGVGK